MSEQNPFASPRPEVVEPASATDSDRPSLSSPASILAHSWLIFMFGGTLLDLWLSRDPVFPSRWGQMGLALQAVLAGAWLGVGRGHAVTRMTTSLLAVAYMYGLTMWFKSPHWFESSLLSTFLATALVTSLLNAIGYQLAPSEHAVRALIVSLMIGLSFLLAVACELVPIYGFPSTRGGYFPSYMFSIIEAIIPAIAAAAAISYLLLLKHRLFQRKKAVFLWVIMLTPFGVGLGAILTGYETMNAINAVTMVVILEVACLTIIYPTNRVLRCWGYSLVGEPPRAPSEEVAAPASERVEAT